MICICGWFLLALGPKLWLLRIASRSMPPKILKPHLSSRTNHLPWAVVVALFRVSCLSCICVGVCVCAADHETLPTPTTTLNKLVYPLRSLWLDWRLWRQQRAFLASLSFVFVYLTVLSPGGMLASWLVYKHTSEILIGTRSKAEIL